MPGAERRASSCCQIPPQRARSVLKQSPHPGTLPAGSCCCHMPARCCSRISAAAASASAPAARAAATAASCGKPMRRSAPTHSCMAGNWQAAIWEKEGPAGAPDGAPQAAAAPPGAAPGAVPSGSGCGTGGGTTAAPAAASVAASAWPVRLGQLSGAASNASCWAGSDWEAECETGGCSHSLLCGRRLCGHLLLPCLPDLPAPSMGYQDPHLLVSFLLLSLPLNPLLLALP